MWTVHHTPICESLLNSSRLRPQKPLDRQDVALILRGSRRRPSDLEDAAAVDEYGTNSFKIGLSCYP